MTTETTLSAEAMPESDEQAPATEDNDLTAAVEAALPDAESMPSAGPAEDEAVTASEAGPERAGPRLSRADRQTYERTLRRFQACGRCSYLLADLRLALGEEKLQAAVLNDIRDGWLPVEGPHTLHTVLANAFGINPDLVYDQYDGLCPECRRRAVLSAVETGGYHLKIRV